MSRIFLCALLALATGLANNPAAGEKPQSGPLTEPLARIVTRQLVNSPHIDSLLAYIGQHPSLPRQDKLYIHAIATEYCHWVAARNRWGKLQVPFDSLLSDDSNPLGSPEQMQRLMSRTQLPNATSEAQRNAQLAYTKRNEAIQCGYVKNSPPDRDSVLAAWRALAQTGDKRGKASLVDLEARLGPNTLRKKYEKEGFRPSHESYELDIGLFDPDKAYVEALFGGLATGDPYLLANLGHILASGYPNGYFVFGSNSELLSSRVAEHVWHLVACEFGWPCDSATSRYMLRACAERGQCNGTSLMNHLQGHSLGSDDMKQIAQIKTILLDGIRNGNWNGIRFVRRGEIKQHVNPNLRTVVSRRPFWFGY